jgi:hypothetical protein
MFRTIEKVDGRVTPALPDFVRALQSFAYHRLPSSHDGMFYGDDQLPVGPGDPHPKTEGRGDFKEKVLSVR